MTKIVEDSGLSVPEREYLIDQYLGSASQKFRENEVLGGAAYLMAALQELIGIVKTHEDQLQLLRTAPKG